jgi:hypothetical protein
LVEAGFAARLAPLPDPSDEDVPLDDPESPEPLEPLDDEEDEDDELSFEEASPPDPPSFVDPALPLELESEDVSSRVERDAPGLAVARRSFLAQPVPLKWIAGAAKAFLIGPPPHSGQVVGSSEWTPRRTSNRFPQFAQS